MPLSIGESAQLACVLEVTARKPGNVHPGKSFEDSTYFDFLKAAMAIGPVVDRTVDLGVGQTVLECVRRCREVADTNANLGIILLIVPLAAVPREIALADGIATVLERLTVQDSRAVYAAIRLARPGGLGQAPSQDVHDDPTSDLRSAMQLAADRDLVARQYSNGFAQVLNEGMPALIRARADGLDWEQGIIRCQLEFMARHPDSLIARKRGVPEAQQAAQWASEILSAGWPKSPYAAWLFDEFDAWLRGVGHARNPGTTADLVTASLFAALRDDRLSYSS